MHVPSFTAVLHQDEEPISLELVRALVSEQFPHLAHPSLREIDSPGTDNRLFRLGVDLVVRMPRTRSAARQLDKVHRWVPVLAPQLPLRVPMPIALGGPARGYPYAWSVGEWIDGAPLGAGSIAKVEEAAVALGGFVAALRGIDPGSGPPPGEHNAYRGCPLALRDARTRARARAWLNWLACSTLDRCSRPGKSRWLPDMKWRRSGLMAT